MYLVAGATGHLGQAVVAQLLAKGAKGRFAVLARDARKAQPYLDQGIEVRIADYDQPQTLEAAFSGIEKLLFISTMSMDRAAQQKRVVDAAAAAGVRHILYTGLAIKDIALSGVRDLMISHFETEDHIKASGMGYTFLRNTMYAEAIPEIIGPQALQQGIALPAGQGRVPYALRAEMGEAAANALLQEGHLNKTYTITGPQAFGYAEVAKALADLKGSPDLYQDIPAEALKQGLEAAGLPEFPIYLILGTLADIKSGQYEIESRDLATLLGRQPKTLPAMLSAIFA